MSAIGLDRFLESIDYTTTSKLQKRAYKRDSIDDRNRKISSKLLLNADNLESGRAASISRGEPGYDKVYVETPCGAYNVGVKIGNRWLLDVRGGKPYITVQDKETAIMLMRELAAEVESGKMNDAIQATQDHYRKS